MLVEPVIFEYSHRPPSIERKKFSLTFLQALADAHLNFASGENLDHVYSMQSGLVNQYVIMHYNVYLCSKKVNGKGFGN